MGTNEGRDEKLPVAPPQVVAQVEFTEWTPDGHLRAASFAGLRDDKKAKEVVRET